LLTFILQFMHMGARIKYASPRAQKGADGAFSM
jgi:hypothetical protein